ncbi:putative F-box domain-containing protein [Seiridium cardinale]
MTSIPGGEPRDTDQAMSAEARSQFVKELKHRDDIIESLQKTIDELFGKLYRRPPSPESEQGQEPQWHLLDWLDNKLDRDGNNIGDSKAQFLFIYDRLNEHDQGLVRTEYHDALMNRTFDYKHLLSALRHAYFKEFTEDQSRNEGAASPVQRLHLLDLPNEVIIHIAQWCHLQPREGKKLLIRSGWGRGWRDPGGLDCFSRVNKVLRRLSSSILFSRLSTSLFPATLHLRLPSLLRNDDITQNARTLSLKVTLIEDDLDLVGRSRGRGGPKLLISTLRSMARLEELHLQFEDLRIDNPEDSFVSELRHIVLSIGLQLDGLRGLSVDVIPCPTSHMTSQNTESWDLSFLASLCPNIERANLWVQDNLHPQPGISGLREFVNLPNLVEIQFKNHRPHGWSEGQILDIVEAFPRLRRLYLPGDLGVPSALSLAPILSRLSSLEVLAISAISWSQNRSLEFLASSVHDVPPQRELGEIAQDIFHHCRLLKELRLSTGRWINGMERGDTVKLFLSTFDAAGMRQGFECVGGRGVAGDNMVPRVFEDNPACLPCGWPRIMRVVDRKNL